MVNKELEQAINSVVRDAKWEVEFLEHARDQDMVIRQRLLNAGHTFNRLASEMFVAAGSVVDD